MARKKSDPPSGPSNAYLVSFGDTMTTLLAFFIVLNSLAEEQTGANLHRGTGSFVQYANSAGLGGTFAGASSANPTPRNETSPLFIVNDQESDAPPSNDPTGPDDDDNQLRVIDREQEQFERFLHEMNRIFPVDTQPRTEGEVVFDLFESLPTTAPYLPPGANKVIAEAIPLLMQPDYRVEIIVWATTPGESAWTRATNQSQEMVKHLALLTRLGPEQRARLSGVGRPWIDAKAKRPVMSVAVRRVEK